MTPVIADLRIRTYSSRYGKFDSSRPLRKRIQEIDSRLGEISPLSSKFKELSQTRFELNSYADALDSLDKGIHRQ